jgi:hypothetical protein
MRRTACTRSRRSKKRSASVTANPRGRAVRHRAGAATAKDGPLARHLCNNFWARAQSRLDAGGRVGCGLRPVILGQLAPLPPEFCWQPLPTQSPRRLLSTIACPARFSMRMGLWLARCQMGAVVFAHNSFDVLVCLLDNGRLPRCRRDPRPLGRNPTFVGAGQRHLCRVAGRCGRTVRSRRAGCAQHRR